MIKNIFLIILILFTAGCRFSGEDSSTGSNIEVRAIFESEACSTVDMRVFVEGPDGNSLSGAVVLVSDSQNSIKVLAFDPDQYCYTGSAAVLSDGLFKVKVNSNASDKTIEQTIQHTPLLVKPVLSVLQDSDGNSVLSGKTLSSDKEIQAAWNSRGDDIVYQVSVKTALRTVYSVSTNAASITIPVQSIPAGSNYMLEIMAQKIYGDPYFENANYYSASVIRSSTVLFDVQ